MILVTLGTQDQKFYRLLDALENSNIKDKIIVQAGGSSDYQSKKMEIFRFIDYKEMEKYIDDADLIITHGGTGSIIMPLQKGKKVIACARLEKYGEHINDHQKELVSVFAEEGYILEFNDGDDIDELIKKSKSFKPKKYVSNTENFIKNLKSIIDE
ncbi:MAG: exopolysaccharide biosynthesis protein [Bacilli bacterium]|nr:exopolysaccharide biosynthesis protein [Bacilli bacterium]